MNRFILNLLAGATALLADAVPARAHQLDARAHQLELWALANPPLFEVGRGGGDGVLFEYVGDAAVMADGSVLVADAGPRRILRFSPGGEAMAVLGGTGRGPGEFGWLQHVFAHGDTIIAYDSSLRRVTAWRPGVDDPEVHSLPQMDGVPATLKAVVSSRTWLLEPNRYPSLGGTGGLKERRRELLSFDSFADESASLGSRLVAYDYAHQIEGGSMTNSVPFLGREHVVAVAGKWVFAPMEEAVLEIWTSQGRSPERRMALPVERPRYDRAAIRALRDEEASARSGEDAEQVRREFDGVLGELPPLAPAVHRMVRMGSDVWVQPFSPGLDGEPEWLVVDIAAGTVRATVSVDPDLTLLAGSDEVAVLLGQTAALEQQFVQVRRVVRAPSP